MSWPSVLPAFLASTVEFVEALTIVLAVGITINWRTSLWGTAAAFTVLALFVTIFGTAIIIYIPIDLLRMIIGIILILFGLQWLKKSVLRYSGIKELHDEEAIYQRKVMALQTAGTAGSREIFDKLGFLTSFKSVLLEGLEVVFIVITFGSTSGTNKSAGLLSASFGALLALIFVICAGAAVRRPLTRIPENTLKFVVGIMLVTFGTFWTGEGFGILWPFQDVFLFVLAAIYMAMCTGLVLWLKARSKQSQIREAAR